LAKLQQLAVSQQVVTADTHTIPSHTHTKVTDYRLHQAQRRLAAQSCLPREDIQASERQGSCIADHIHSCTLLIATTSTDSYALIALPHSSFNCLRCCASSVYKLDTATTTLTRRHANPCNKCGNKAV